MLNCPFSWLKTDGLQILVHFIPNTPLFLVLFSPVLSSSPSLLHVRARTHTQRPCLELGEDWGRMEWPVTVANRSDQYREMCHILLHFLIVQQSIALLSPQTFLKGSTLFISPCCFLGWVCSLWDTQNRKGGDGPKCSKFKWLGLTAVPPVAYAYAQMCGVYEWMCACMRRSVHALLGSQRSIISTLLYPQETYPTWGGTQHRRIYSSLEINVIWKNSFALMISCSRHLE